MTVQNTNTKNIYVGNGSTTVFPFTFYTLSEHPEYIKVYITGADGVDVLTENYTIDMQAQNVTYPKNGSPLKQGEKITIARELPLLQDLNLVNQGPFFAEEIEKGFDEVVMIAQQLSEGIQRALAMAISADAESFDNKIPLVAGKSIKVNDDGTGFEVTEDPAKVLPLAESAVETAKENANIAINNASAALTSKEEAEKYAKEVISKIRAYSNIAEMVADENIKAGQTAQTLGYYEANDGGGGTYFIRSKTANDVADGGSIHELQNGLVAELLTGNEIISAKQFGIVGDGVTDETEKIKKILNRTEKVFFPKGIYIYSDIIECKTSFFGEGKDLTVFHNISNPNYASFRLGSDTEVYGFKVKVEQTTRDGKGYNSSPISTMSRVSDVYIHDLKIEGGNSTAIFIYGSKRIIIKNCTVLNTLADGIHITNAAQDVLVDGCYIEGTGDDGIAFVSYEVDGSRCCNCKAVNNTVKSTKTRGIINGASENIIISNNYVTNCSSSGILVHSHYGGWDFLSAKNTIITNNIVVNNLQYYLPSTTRTMGEIRVVEAARMDYFLNEGTVIKGNTIITDGLGFECFQTKDVIFSGNFVKAPWGFYETTGVGVAPYPLNIIIDNNVFDGVKNNCSIDRGNNISVINNRFNVVSGNPIAINFGNVAYGMVNNNVVYNQEDANGSITIANCRNFSVGYNIPTPSVYRHSNPNAESDDGEWNVSFYGNAIGHTIPISNTQDHVPAIGTISLNSPKTKLQIKTGGTTDTVEYKYITLED